MTRSTFSRFSAACGWITVAYGLLLLMLVLATVSALAQRPASAPLDQAGQNSPSTANGSLERAQQSLDRQAPVFIENKGQWDRRARFLLQSTGLDSWITDRGIVYDLYQLTPARTSEKQPLQHLLASQGANKENPPALNRRGHVVAVEFLGASFAPTVHGYERQPGYHNYFIGNDSTKWATNVALYAQAEIEGLYPGIDAVFYLDSGSPRYDLVVAPGGDPRQVRMSIQGATAIGVTPGGSLSMATSLGEIEQRGLYAYQEIAAGHRQQVKCGFVVDRSGEVRFEVGSYDRKRPLVIDPVVVYSTFLGGSDYDGGYGIAVDGDGNAYVTGTTNSSNFPTTSGAYDRGIGGSEDAFITKLNSAGSARVYSTFLGGSDFDDGCAIAVDASGNAYVTGYTSSSNFPMTSGVYRGGSHDAFVTRLSSSGSSLVYSICLGGSSDDYGYGIAVGGSANAYVTGYTSSSNFPTTAGAPDGTLGGAYDYDAFVTRLSSSGTRVYSTFLGGSDYDIGYGIAVDASGNAYVTGTTNSSNFPTTSGAYDRGIGGSEDAFVTRLSSSGTSLVYSTFLGGSSGDGGRAITVGENANAYVTGYTYSTSFPTTARGYWGNEDAFVTRLSSSGGSLVYSTCLGGSEIDEGRGIVVTEGGNIYVTGKTYSTDFPTCATYSPLSSSHGGNSDVFVTLISGSDNSRINYSGFLGGSSYDGGYAIALDSNGNAYVTGYTGSSSFPTTSGAYDESYNSTMDAFVTKINSAGSGSCILALSAFLGGSGSDDGSAIATVVNMTDAQMKGAAGEAIAEQQMSLQLIPNPITSDGQLRVSVAQPGILDVTIYDMLGHPVWKLSKVDVEHAGELEIPIDVSDLGSGSYTIDVICNDQHSSTRLHVIR